VLCVFDTLPVVDYFFARSLCASAIKSTSIFFSVALVHFMSL